MNRFLATTARCPHCNRRPGIRVNDSERERYRSVDPEHVVMTVNCTRCGEVYPVKARNVQEAA